MRFVDWFLYTSLFTACCAIGLCMATEQLVLGALPVFISGLHILVLGSTLLVYNTPRIIRRPYGRVRAAQPYRRWFFFFFFVGLVLSLCGMYSLPPQVLLICGLLGCLAFAYFLPVLPFKSRKRLRDIGWLKIAVLAAVWTMATSVLPMLYYDRPWSSYLVEILLRFVFIFILCIVFDIRDMGADRINNIDTLPVRVGLANSYRLINMLLLVFALLSVVQYSRYPSVHRLIGGLLTVVATSLMVSYLRKKPSERAYMCLADGVMLLYAVLVTVTL